MDAFPSVSVESGIKSFLIFFNKASVSCYNRFKNEILCLKFSVSPAGFPLSRESSVRTELRGQTQCPPRHTEVLEKQLHPDRLRSSAHQSLTAAHRNVSCLDQRNYRRSLSFCPSDVWQRESIPQVHSIAVRLLFWHVKGQAGQLQLQTDHKY